MRQAHHNDPVDLYYQGDTLTHIGNADAYTTFHGLDNSVMAQTQIIDGKPESSFYLQGENGNVEGVATESSKLYQYAPFGVSSNMK